MFDEPLFSKTPLIHSTQISNIIDCPAYLKLENVHASHSYKFRGLSYYAQRVKQKFGADAHLVAASGGNAGIAVAAAGNALRLRCTIYLPVGAAQRTIDFLKSLDAEVIVIGKHFAEALNAAKEAVASDAKAVLIPAYDDPILWEGHSSMIQEVSEQLKSKPGVIFCSVGGGGLLGGIITGCKKVGWDDVPIATLETIGSNCFHYSMEMSRGHKEFCKTLPDDVHAITVDGLTLAHFDTFTSKASGSLGASEPAAGVVRMALERTGRVTCVSVPDELSMKAAALLADQHHMLVELACSTTLTAGYERKLFDTVVDRREDKDAPALFIVCGGFKVTLQEVYEYEKLVTGKNQYDVIYGDGKVLTVGN